ncbi:thioredoxin domain-containing protein [Enterococcus faecium]|uniref:thioredoxin domain-containing protein n=1 Tax=Enterococcus faecium TaxID=1352 RepID=UPI0027B5EB61|nr:thioredoxin domain-containing protein [Enterococcus faecium]MDQ2047374.1 thioredoxin domain-containing protein [Enterococcus faecium]
MNKKIFSICVLIFTVSIIFFTDHSYIKYIESQNDPVYLDESNQEKIVFYRNDCRDCEKIMPYLIRHNFLYHDLIFVNMNNKENKRYIKEYGLTSVPTIIFLKQRYVGTDISKIKTLVMSKGDDF